MGHIKSKISGGCAMIGFFIAIASGILMSVQGVFNTGVSKTTGLWVSNSWVQATALLICLGGWLITGREHFSMLFKVQPKYMLLGGVLGALITLTVMQSMNALGPAKAVLFIVIAQIASAYVIQLLGWFGAQKTDLSVHKILGLGIAVTGILIFQWEKSA